MTPNELETLRGQIDQVDHELIDLLAKRMALVESIGKYKKVHSLAPLDAARWNTVLEDRVAIGTSLSMPASFICSIFAVIHERSLEIEKGTKI